MPEDEPGTGSKRSLRLVHIAPLLIGVLIAARASELIRDNSFLWHIRAGTLQIDLSRVLTVDPFSFTAGGESWRTQSWLLELGYGWAERTWTSLAWANWLVFICGVLTFVLIGVAIYARAKSPLIVTAGLIVGVLLFAPFAHPRPVIVSYVLLAAVALAVMRPDRLAWVLPPLFWVFASVHGSWILAGGLVVLVVLQTRDRTLLRAGIVSLVVTAMTAHGIGSWGVVVDFFGSRDALGLIQEWGPPNLFDIAQAPYLVVVAGILIATARGKVTGRDLAVVLPFLLFGFSSQRAIVPAAIVLLPYAATAIPVPSKRSAPMSSSVIVASALVLLAVSIMPMLVRPLGVLDDERFPSDEVVDAVRGTIAYEDTAVGGFLIYADWPATDVFVDDRAELYGFARLDAARRAQSGDYEETFAEYGIQTAIVDRDAPLAARLIDHGWVEVASSPGHIAFVAPEGP